MTTMTSGKRGSKAAALLLLFATLAAVLASLLVPAALRWYSLGDEIMTSRTSVSQAVEETRAQEALLEAEQKWRFFRADDSAGFIDSKGITLLDAAEEILGNSVMNFGGSVLSKSVLPDDQTPFAVKASLQAALPRGAVMPFLIELESKPPYLILDKLSVTGMSGGNAMVSVSGTAFGLAEAQR